jgi:hypothetical protein
MASAICSSIGWPFSINLNTTLAGLMTAAGEFSEPEGLKASEAEPVTSAL